MKNAVSLCTENVYEIKDHDKFMNEVDRVTKLVNTVEKYGSIFHVRVFKVESIAGKPFFMKTFYYNTDWLNEYDQVILDNY